MSSSTMFECCMAWPISLSQLALVFPLILAFYIFISVIYNLYFHPLRKFPGPRVAAASKIPNVWNILSGSRVSYLRNLHDLYGSVIRTAPYELSFTDSAAWKVLYTRRPFPKNIEFHYHRHPNRPHNILVSDDADHSRQRRIYIKAFSDAALQEQEPVIQTYVDGFIQKLREKTKGAKYGEVDIVQWYSWLIFDIVGDFSLGQPFNALHSEDLHRELSNSLYDGPKALVFANATKNFPPLNRIMRLVIPKGLIKKHIRQYEVTTDLVDHRIASDTDRPDFLSHILRHNTKAQLSRQEIRSNASMLINAANDTSATLLSGMTYLLSRSPEVLQKLTTEIREAFQKESEISLGTVNELKYLSAVIQESFRVYPPIPEGLARVVPPEGATICGHWVVGGTFVQISPCAANHSAANFAKPHSFIPDRWLDAAFDSDDKDVLQPFSIGTRSCIGYKLANAMVRLVMVKLLWNFDMELCEPDRDWLKQRSWIMWEKGPLQLRLKAAPGRSQD